MIKRGASQSPPDETDDGVFQPLACERCAAPLGKFYETAPAGFDALRGKFTLDIDALTSYAWRCVCDLFDVLVARREPVIRFPRRASKGAGP